jgi:hypothetical protein
MQEYWVWCLHHLGYIPATGINNMAIEELPQSQLCPISQQERLPMDVIYKIYPKRKELGNEWYSYLQEVSDGNS